MIDLFESCRAEISSLIVRNELDAALNLIMRVALQMARSDAALGQVFSSPALDFLSQEIGAKARNSNAGPGRDQEESGQRAAERARQDGKRAPERIIYVVSELYVVGGHTRLLEDMIRLQPARDSHILVTNPFNRDPASIVPNFIVQAAQDVQVAPPGNSQLARLHWLQGRLDELGPDAVVLLNHEHDAVAIAAPDCSRVRTVFVHHADYTFTLGPHMSGAIHVDLHPRRYFACKQHRDVNNRYWPITVPDLGARLPESVRRESSGLVTCSSGSTPKFTVRYQASYFTELANILKYSGGRHIHIGPLREEQLHRIRTGLTACGISHDHFVHIPWVRSLWRTLIDQNVGLYIASFPIFGGRALLEALGSGTPVLAHAHSFNSCFSDIQMLYPECLAWRTPEELHQAIAKMDTALLRNHATLGRAWYAKHFSTEHFVKCLDVLVEGEATVEPFRPAGCDPDPLAPFLAIGGLTDYVSHKLIIGTMLDELGLAAQAEACSVEIMQLDKVVAEAYHQAGLKKLAAKDPASAIALFSRAVAILPETPQYLNSLACALYDAGNVDLARVHLEQALRLLPDFPLAKQNLDIVLQRRDGVQG